MNKSSLGNGYGLNRNVKAARALGAAIPPLSNVNVKPGQSFNRSATGHSGKKHFQGASSHNAK